MPDGSADSILAESIDDLGESPLHKACTGGHIDLVLKLLEMREKVATRRNKDRMDPFLLLAQSEGKKID